MEELSVRNNPMLYGHELAEQQLVSDMTSGRMAHGWVFTGSEGVGKATLAYRFARALLAGRTTLDMPEDHPVFRRVEAGSHSDLLMIEPIYDADKDEKKQIINVEQARKINDFLALTPGESDWRVVIIDPADALNANAANAILKILEEPPAQAVIILVSHNSGRLLPTIISRCRTLRLKPLQEDNFVHVLRQVAPGQPDDVVRALGILSEYSPGVALSLVELEAVELYSEIIALLADFPLINPQKLHGFANKFTAGKKANSRWRVFTRLMLCLLARTSKFEISRKAGAVVLEPLNDAEAAVLERLLGAHPAAIWAERWQEVMDQFVLSEKLYLDYKQAVIVFFHSLISTEGFQLGDTAA